MILIVIGICLIFYSLLSALNRRTITQDSKRSKEKEDEVARRWARDVEESMKARAANLPPEVAKQYTTNADEILELKKMQQELLNRPPTIIRQLILMSPDGKTRKKKEY